MPSHNVKENSMGMLVSSTQDNIRNNWMYAVVSATTGLLFLLLYAGGTGEFLGTTLISWETKDVVDGIQSNGSLFGDPSYAAWATRDNAGFFVHMPNAMTIAVAYLILAGLVFVVTQGIQQRSFAMSFTPAITALVVTTIISTSIELFDVYVPFVSGGLALIALIASIYRNRQHNVLAAPRIPDAIPTVESETTTDRGRTHT
jgi:hypothetical protein